MILILQVEHRCFCLVCSFEAKALSSGLSFAQALPHSRWSSELRAGQTCGGQPGGRGWWWRRWRVPVFLDAAKCIWYTSSSTSKTHRTGRNHGMRWIFLVDFFGRFWNYVCVSFGLDRLECNIECIVEEIFTSSHRHVSRIANFSGRKRSVEKVRVFARGQMARLMR